MTIARVSLITFLLAASATALSAQTAPAFAQRQIDTLPKQGALPPDRDDTRSVAVGDVDGDGDLDLVIANSSPPGRGRRLYLNDGKGRFTDATSGRLPITSTWDNSEHLALGDLDEDGDLDLLVVGPFGDVLFLNDGFGTFFDATPRLPAGYSAEIAFGDVDGDGDLDLALATPVAQGQNHVYRNLLRQLHAPLLLRTAHAYRLEIYARYGPASSQTWALPALAAGTASVPWPPFGTLGLDPAKSVLLPQVIVPQWDGLAAIDLNVPNVPALAGFVLYAQALVQPGSAPRRSRLTNVVRDVLGR